jgi:hypothetical protein
MGENAEYCETATGNGLNNGDLHHRQQGTVSDPITTQNAQGIRGKRQRTGAWESAVSMSAAPHMSIRKPLIQSWLDAYALTTCAHGQERRNS